MFKVLNYRKASFATCYNIYILNMSISVVTEDFYRFLKVIISVKFCRAFQVRKSIFAWEASNE